MRPPGLYETLPPVLTENVEVYVSLPYSSD